MVVGVIAGGGGGEGATDVVVVERGTAVVVERACGVDTVDDACAWMLTCEGGWRCSTVAPAAATTNTPSTDVETASRRRTRA